MHFDPATTGMHLLKVGKTTEALPYLAQAHERDPADRTILQGYSAALQTIGRPDLAVEVYRRVAATHPDDPEVFVGLAHAFKAAGALAKAVAALGRAIELEPTHAQAAGSLARLLRENGQPEDACNRLEYALASHPQDALLTWEYARALWAADRLDESEQQFERHRSLRPQDARNRVALGRIASARGDVATARTLFVEAMGLDRNDAAAWWELAHADPTAIDAIASAHVHDLARSAPLAEQRELFEDILVRIADREGRYADAIAHQERANRMREAAGGNRIPYDPDSHAREVDALIATYRSPLFDRFKSDGNDSPAPVFIIGLPRSGTTLVERMLAAHPRIAGVGEQQLARRALVRALDATPSGLGQMAGTTLRAAADWHLAELEQRRQRLAPKSGATYIADKLPDNYLLAGWLQLCFPNAALIHCQRDPRDVAISCWMGRFSEMPWSYEMDHIVVRIEQHRRLMRHWRQVLPRPPLQIAYEDLVARPQHVLTDALRGLGLEWDEAIMSFHRADGAVRTASQIQVRQPLNNRSVGRWRNYADVLAPVLPRLEAIVAQDRLDADAA